MNNFIISADLAQVNDYTAITVLESIKKKNTTAEYHLRHIERPERGTTYPKIVDRLKVIAHSEKIKKNRKTVVIDITGVGLPVWDLLNNADIRYSHNTELKGIHITGGNVVTEERDIFKVPKRDLISSLQVAFQNGQLKIAKGLAEADTLVRELTNFKVKINLNGHDQYEAWREGIHDDIVLSAAMGVWLASRPVFDISSLIS
jgi:hypothetical protein